jgi:hypothetical protein
LSDVAKIFSHSMGGLFNLEAISFVVQKLFNFMQSHLSILSLSCWAAWVSKAYDGEKTTSSTNVAGKSGYLTCRKLKLDPCLSPCVSINSKWFKALNIKPEILKLVQDRAGYTQKISWFHTQNEHLVCLNISVFWLLEKAKQTTKKVRLC